MRGTAEHLAVTIGAGQVPPTAVAALESAAWQRTFSKFLFEVATTRAFLWVATNSKTSPLRVETELATVASRLADASRQNTLAAFELTARDAEARARRAPDIDPFLALPEPTEKP